MGVVQRCTLLLSTSNLTSLSVRKMQAVPLIFKRHHGANLEELYRWMDWDENMTREENVQKSEGAYQTAKGKIYSKKPFKFLLEAGKRYSWCSCGYSHSQPFCDGEHKQRWVMSGLKPVKFVATQTKEVWLCNCKQTNSKPWCDKSCDLPEVAETRI